MKINLSNAWLIGDEGLTSAAAALALASKARLERTDRPKVDGGDGGEYRDPRCCPKVVDGVAVMPVQASYLYHGRDFWMDLFGGLSYQCLADEVERLAMDASIRGVVFDVNCPGGSVDGVREFVDAVKGLAAVKPTLMVAHDQATSGAYWPFAVCDEIVATPTGRVGSVGGVSAIDDTTGMFEQLGIKRTAITAPEGSAELKAAGMPGTPVTEAQIKNRIAQLAEPVAMFVADVAAGRGMSVDAVAALQAGTYPAMDAVRRGLADRVEPARDAITRFVQKYGSVAAGVGSVPAPAAVPAEDPEGDPPGDQGSRGGASPAQNGRKAQEFVMDFSKLTEDQLRAGAPELVGKIEAGARKSPAASVEELDKVYAADPDFVVECLKGKRSIDGAKIAWGEKQQKVAADTAAELTKARAALNEANAKVAELTGQVAAIKRDNRGTDPVGTDHAAADAGGKASDGQDYLSVVAAKKEDLMLKDNMAPAQASAMAHQIVQRAKPGLYAEYKKSIGSGVNAAKIAKK